MEVRNHVTAVRGPSYEAKFSSADSERQVNFLHRPGQVILKAHVLRGEFERGKSIRLQLQTDFRVGNQSGNGSSTSGSAVTEKNQRAVC